MKMKRTQLPSSASSLEPRSEPVPSPTAPLPSLAGVRLSGLSGAGTWRCRTPGGEYFVHKVATSGHQSLRLNAQRQKQERAAWCLPSGFRTPKVYRHGDLDGQAFFDMEWVTGRAAPDYLATASVPEVRAFAERLAAYLQWAWSTPPLHEVGSRDILDALQSRLDSIITRARSECLGYRTLVLLEYLRNQVLKPDLTASFQPSFCHGDLTLENMIVDTRGQIWLLDWLDAPYEHMLFDVAKLYQDIWAGWYTRTYRPIAPYVLAHLTRTVRQQVNIVEQESVNHRKLREVILATTFARILPYTSTHRDFEFVAQRLERCVHRLCNFT